MKVKIYHLGESATWKAKNFKTKITIKSFQLLNNLTSLLPKLLSGEIRVKDVERFAEEKI